MKIFKTCLAVFAALLAVSACSKKEGGDGTSSISLSQTSTYDFQAETTSDYPPKTPLTVTVTNTGSVATGKLTISIDGAAASSFNLSKTSIDNIAPAGSDTFTVVPVQGLDEGDYQANVHVSGKGIAEKSFGVRFVVTDMEVDEVRIKSQPTQTVYGVGEPFNVDGLQVVTVSNGVETPLALTSDSEYLIYDFSEPSHKDPDSGVITPSKVQIVVGAAPVQEISVTVLSLGDRIEAAKGTIATIVIYGNELTSDEITINAANTDITLTTPEGSTTVRTIKKAVTSYFMTINGGGGGIKVTLAGYVTIKGWASSEYGGSDETSNNNVLIRLSEGAVLEMKGNSRITGNVVDRSTTSSNWVDGAAVKITNAEWIISENAQVTNNGFIAGTGLVYGGACYFTGASTAIRIKDNAKISGNFVLSGGNVLGGAIGGEQGCIYMDGGEVSGNYAKSTAGAASGGAFCLVNGTVKSILKGGTIKDNYTMFKTNTRGSAIVCGNTEAVTLGGSINIPAGSVDFVAEGDLKKDVGNAISMTLSGATPLSVNSVNIIDGTLATTSKIMLDINYDGSIMAGLTDLNADTRVIRKYTIVDSAVSIADFAGNAPADKFTLRNYLNWRTTAFTSLSGKSINSNGYMTTP